MNKASAKEWIIKAWHNHSSARILLDANHYTDTIAIELHYAAEKYFKSLLAYENKKIPKTHDLVELYEFIKEYVVIDDDEILSVITKYHVEDSYPQYSRPLPSIEEVKNVLVFVERVFDKVCDVLEIDKNEIIQ
jgi:HEPN domain-containing protein